MSVRLLTAFLVVGLSQIVLAQTPAVPPALGYDDSFQIVPANLGVAGIFTAANTGFHASPAFNVTSSDICVNAYVMNPNGSMRACCGCRVPANGFATGLLPGGTAGGANVTVKLLATLPSRVAPNAPPSLCDPRVSPSSGLGVSGGFASGMRAWVLDFNALPTFEKVQAEFSPLSENELSRLTSSCALVQNQCTCTTQNQQGIPSR